MLLPWSVAAFAGLGNLIGLFSQGAFASFLTGLPGIAFVVGCLFLAAWPMGSEFHHRTLPLLLSQPHCRFRLWREKMVATSLGISALTLVYVSAGVVYAAFTLWLGWRKWAKLEARDAPEWQPVSLPAWVTPQELERTGGLSGRAKTWLRNSSIMVYPSNLRHRNMAEIRFPDQKTFLIHWPTHRRNEKPSTEPNPPNKSHETNH